MPLFWAPWVESMTLASIAAGADGILIEVHPDPKKAAVDPLQPLDFKQFKSLIKKSRKVASSINKKNNLMLDFDQCINKIKIIKSEKYCLIIGGQGANKARSPKIWNRILRKNKINCKMIPLEVKQNSLKKLLNFFEK